MPTAEEYASWEWAIDAPYLEAKGKPRKRGNPGSDTESVSGMDTDEKPNGTDQGREPQIDIVPERCGHLERTVSTQDILEAKLECGSSILKPIERPGMNAYKRYELALVTNFLNVLAESPWNKWRIPQLPPRREVL